MAYSLLFLEYVVEFASNDNCPNILQFARHIFQLIQEQKVIKYAAFIRSNPRYAELWTATGEFNYALLEQRIQERISGIQMNDDVTGLHDKVNTLESALKLERETSQARTESLLKLERETSQAEIENLKKSEKAITGRLLAVLESTQAIAEQRRVELQSCQHPPTFYERTKALFRGQ